jgi:4-hydroxy-3-methylbut-2-enyl diphosphate reductase
MEIKKAEHMGFCFGVKNAVDYAIKELDESGKIYSYGEIIHNKDVVDSLATKGLLVIDDKDAASLLEAPIDKIKTIDAKILIRSHGVPKKIIDFLDENNLEYIDASCPRVKSIHKIVSKYSSQGYEIIVIGDEFHPEIIGIVGWIDGKYHIADNLEKLKQIKIDKEKNYSLVCQTTFNYNILKEIVEFLEKNDYTNIVINNTICDATLKRQKSCYQLASNCDVMLVVGGKNSSNTKKLYELCKEKCEKTFLIENYKEIPYKYIDKNTRIGITAGASTPDWVIEEVIRNVRESEQNNE